MTWITISESIRPRRFISYSRRDYDSIRRYLGIRGLLDEEYWLDMEQIALGEDWRSVIDQAVHECDEFVLFISDHSLGSKVVAEEIELARRYGKTICPIIIEPLPDESSVPTSHLQTIDATKMDPVSLDKALVELLSPQPPSAGAPAPDAAGIKTIAARHVWPSFELAPSRRSEEASRVLRSVAVTCADHSAIVLNHGLLAYFNGQHDIGLSEIERYAHAADSFAGWYFLALLGPRLRAIRALPLPRAQRTREAAARAASLGDNPLALLLDGLYAVCAENQSPHRLQRTLHMFDEALHHTREAPSEFLRFLIAMEANFGEFGSAEQPLLSVFEEIISHGS